MAEQVSKENPFNWITSWVVFHQPIVKNMRKSNWIMISPGFNAKVPKIFELPPPTFSQANPLLGRLKIKGMGATI